MSREHPLAFARRTLTDEQWSSFMTLWGRNQTPVPCPFVEAVLHDPQEHDTWRELSPIVPTAAAQNVRTMALTGMHMRRSAWWSEIPRAGHDVVEVHGEIEAT